MQAKKSNVIISFAYLVLSLYTFCVAGYTYIVMIVS